MNPLRERYDVAVLDLDGVVYIGSRAVPGAAEALAGAGAAGMHLAFVTNNAARPPSAVAEHLRTLGINAESRDVVTSAQAAARLVARAVPAGAAVYVIGGPGLEEALREHGLVPVTRFEDQPVAVVQGYGPDMPWRQVINGAILVREGLPWVASNLDLTVPTQRGPGPGNGTLVDLVARFSGREPEVAGKPRRPLFEETLDRVGGTTPLVVGDRIDTDIDGAREKGWDSLLVMTGVTTLDHVADLAPGHRPTFVGADLGALATDGGSAGWTGAVIEGALRVTGDGDAHAWYQAAAEALWAHRDATGHPATVGDAAPPR